MPKVGRINLIFAMILLSSGCASLHPNTGGEIEHVVVIWLKEPGNADARQKLIDHSREFKKIPGLKSIEVGPVLPSDRKGVDSSFDVALVMTFANESALRAYDQHPIHQQAVKEVLLPLAAKFVIYDFVPR